MVDDRFANCPQWIHEVPDEMKSREDTCGELNISCEGMHFLRAALDLPAPDLLIGQPTP